MGYESRIYLVAGTEFMEGGAGPQHEKKTFAPVIASFELGKMDGKPICFNKPSPYYFYEPGSPNKACDEDAYGDEPTYCTVQEFLDCMKAHYIYRDTPWRAAVTAAVKALSASSPWGRHNYIIHVGH